MKTFTYLFCFVLLTQISFSQSKSDLPYSEIPKEEESYTAGAVAARMIDGLGFRFYWATEGLTQDDLSFQPNEDARTTGETVDHIYILSQVITSVAARTTFKPIEEELTFAEKRKRTLYNLKTAADIFRDSDDLSEFKLDFGVKQYPFWNAINGPIADAIWHCGQIASFRRSSGNPFSSQVNLMEGNLKG